MLICILLSRNPDLWRLSLTLQNKAENSEEVSAEAAPIEEAETKSDDPKKEAEEEKEAEEGKEAAEKKD